MGGVDTGSSRTIVVALGSNLGDRAANLQFAIDGLRRLLTDLKVSQFIETEPQGVSPQPRFMNAVAVGTSSMQAEALLRELQAIELAGGRERPYAGAPRTLDLDLILVGGEIVRVPFLQVPHPRFRERRFVLEPLVEIAPSVIDPVTGQSAEELLSKLGREPAG